MTCFESCREQGCDMEHLWEGEYSGVQNRLLLVTGDHICTL